MLTGSELLAKIAEVTATGASKTDIARACGYVTTKKDGSERINFTAYYEAVIAAKGVDLGTSAPKGKAPGRGKPLSFRIKASKAGVIPVTAGYSALIAVGDGDYVTIEQIANGLILRKEATDAPADAPDVVTYESEPAPY
jgi:hypothetical protein